MIIKLFRGKIGCNLRRSFIPFVALLILLLEGSLNDNFLLAEGQDSSEFNSYIVKVK